MRNRFSTSAILWFISLGMIGAVAQTTHAQTYNAVSEFSLTQGGTTGVWSYGYSAYGRIDSRVVNDTFYPFSQRGTDASCGSNFTKWTSPEVEVGIPVIGRFDSASTVHCNGFNYPPDMLAVHPGYHWDASRRSVLRWTDPAAATYLVQGAFEKLDPRATTDLKILKNATAPALFSGVVHNGNYQQAFSFTVDVAQGDTIDFSIGDAGDGYYSDSTGIAVTIGPPPTTCVAPPANLQVFLPGEDSTIDVQSGNAKGSLIGDAT